jgi:hypothetical protein
MSILILFIRPDPGIFNLKDYKLIWLEENFVVAVKMQTLPFFMALLKLFLI